MGHAAIRIRRDDAGDAGHAPTYPPPLRASRDKYCVPRTIGVHAIIACRLGLDEAAWDFWRRSAEIDLDVEHGGAAEGIHIACAGANWQVAVLGFAGLATALQSDHLRLRPRLPRAWSRLAFPLVWKGCPVSVDIVPGATTVRNRGTTPLTVTVGAQTQEIPPGAAGLFRTKG